MSNSLETVHDVDGPWSLATSKRFWEGFAPSALAAQDEDASIHAAFLSDTDWQRIDVVISQVDDAARVVVTGEGDLDAATAQVLRFMSLDIDGRGWPDVADRDSVIADAQRRLPGFRPCGFFSPYEAAAWAVLSQRISMRQAATIKSRLTQEHGDNGAFPAPAVLRELDLNLPGRKTEYLHAVAEAALDGALSGSRLRALPPRGRVAPGARDQGPRSVRGRARGDPWRQLPRRSPQKRGTLERRDRSAVRSGCFGRLDHGSLATVSVLGGGAPARAPRGTHARDRARAPRALSARPRVAVWDRSGG